jgi:hypothetical protein
VERVEFAHPGFRDFHDIGAGMSGFNPADEHQYGGFRICLGENYPGVWIAVVLRQSGGDITFQGRTSDRWTTKDFYRPGDALAEAKNFIDRGDLG